MKYLAIVSHPRSGSSYLNRLLQHFNNVLVVMEPFHHNESVAMGHIRATLGKRYEPFLKAVENQASSAGEYAHAEPGSFLELMADQSEESILAFKIFPDHLSDGKLIELLAGIDHAVFLYRNPLHSFISNEIASRSAVWSGVDTSAENPEFDPARFVAWIQRNTEFMEFCRDAVRHSGTELTEICYEELLSASEPLTLLDQTMSTTSCRLGKAKSTGIRKTERQDTRALAEDKVSNPVELKCWLLQFGLNKLNNVEEPCRELGTLHSRMRDLLASRIYRFVNRN